MSRGPQLALALALFSAAAWVASPRPAPASTPMVELADGRWVPISELDGAPTSVRHGDRVEQIDGELRALTPLDPLAFGQPLDLNLATAAQLQALPGLGPSLAERVVAQREAEGPFASVEALEDVRGIGPATRLRLQPWIVAGPP